MRQIGLASTNRGNLTSAEAQIRRTMLDALAPNFAAALAVRQLAPGPSRLASDFEALRGAFIEGALKEIKIRPLPEGRQAPPLFHAAFRGAGFPNSWFDLFLRDAADRLKDEHAFEAIWNAEQAKPGVALVFESGPFRLHPTMS